MLQPPFFRRKNFGLASLLVCQVNFFITSSVTKKGGCHAESSGQAQIPYTGVTQDLHERLAMHNSGHVPHTSKFAPWYIETTIAFRDKEKAFAYERYLKSGAGRAYAIKHF